MKCGRIWNTKGAEGLGVTSGLVVKGALSRSSLGSCTCGTNMVCSKRNLVKF